MKKLGILALIFVALFFVFGIAGALMVAAGGVDFVSNADWSWAKELGDVDISAPVQNSHAERISFSADADIKGYDRLVIDQVSLSKVKVISSDGSMLTVTVDGNYSAELIEKYGITDGSRYTIDIGVSETISSSDASTRCPVSLKAVDGELRLYVDGTQYYNVGYDVTVALPRDYSGSLVIPDQTGSVYLRGLKLDNLEVEGCLGKLEAEDMWAQELIVKGCLGKVDIDGNISQLSITDCGGRVEVESDSRLTGTSYITGNLGKVDVSIERGPLAVERKGNLGSVSVEGRADSSAGAKLIISDNLGSVHVEIGD